MFTSGSKFSLAKVFLGEGMEKDIATFDLLVRDLPPTRNFFVFAGLEQVVDYLQNFKFSPQQLRWIRRSFKFDQRVMRYFSKMKFTGDMYAMPEGTIFFPQEPVIRITAPIIEAQIIEMFIVNTVYLQTILASKAARFIAAVGKKEAGIGFNRSYGIDAAMKSSRINEIFGIKNSLSLFHYKNKSHVFGAGTFHYLIKAFDKEMDAYRAYFKHLGGAGYVLIDTYGSIQGIKRFIKAAKEYKARGIFVQGLQLDSGDLFALSKAARKMLDKAGLSYVKIMAMSNLDERKVAQLEKKGAPIDLYAGSTTFLTPEDQPTLELVYKLCQIQRGKKIIPTMKTSAKKVSLPGKKQVYRHARNDRYYSDTIALEEEKIKGTKLLQPIIRKGQIIKPLPSLPVIRKYYFQKKKNFPKALFSVTVPFEYPVTCSQGVRSLLQKTRNKAH